MYNNSLFNNFSICAKQSGGYSNCKGRFSLEPEQYSFDLVGLNWFEGDVSEEEMGDYQISFRGETSDLNKVEIGKTYNSERVMSIVVTKRIVQVFYGEDEKPYAEYNINIQPEIFIGINIIADMNDTASVEIISESDYILLENIFWKCRVGNLYVAVDDTKIEDGYLGYYADCWNRPIWLFGDSYFNCTAPNRWTSYLLKNNNKNYMLNGFPGRNSDQALTSLKNALMYATPEEIIWCMGMNDGDQETLNKTWKADVEELMRICKKKQIRLVLATTPTCPGVNNDYKNKYIKDSGFRYIDFADAVGSYNSKNWYSGMLQDENNPEACHPTEKGAYALYMEAVLKCPELMGK